VSIRYQKTEAGRQAIRERTLALTRQARNLLLIIDGSRSGAEWLGLVAGSTPDDLEQLAGQGLVVALAAPAAVVAPPDRKSVV
jgi:hypothetical protein